MYPCQKCGTCCRAIGCDKLEGTLCTIYDSRPDICRVDVIYDSFRTQMNRRLFYAMTQEACEFLRARQARS